MRTALTLLVSLLVGIWPALSQPTPTDSCINYNTNYSVCTQCLPGLYLEYFFCIPCNPLCACSSNKNYCQSCLNVTYLARTYQSYRTQQNVCVLCNQTIPFCLQCNNNLTCSKCMMGRYLTNGVCSNQTCTLNCEICHDSTACHECSPGYFVNQTTGLCSNLACQNNCKLCNNQVSCQLCQAGYFASQGICQPCVDNCAICNDNTTCLGCIPSYILLNGSCYSTGISNCIGYTGGVANPTCLVCEPGYYNAQGSCTQCSGCLLCTQAFLCQTQCQPGYNKFNYACLQFEAFIYFGGLLSIIMLLMVAM